MACGVQISLGGPLVTVACHLLVSGEHDDEQTEAEPAGCDQPQPPPEVDNSRRLRQVARFVVERPLYGPHHVLRVLTFVFRGPYQPNETPGNQRSRRPAIARRVQGRICSKPGGGRPTGHPNPDPSSTDNKGLDRHGSHRRDGCRELLLASGLLIWPRISTRSGLTDRLIEARLISRLPHRTVKGVIMRCLSTPQLSGVPTTLLPRADPVAT